jgi:hypothetical protein
MPVASAEASVQPSSSVTPFLLILLTVPQQMHEG